MPLSLSNESKNSLIIANEIATTTGMTWNEATMSWQNATGTWDNPGRSLSNEAKNALSVANESK